MYSSARSAALGFSMESPFVKLGVVGTTNVAKRADHRESFCAPSPIPLAAITRSAPAAIQG